MPLRRPAAYFVVEDVHRLGPRDALYELPALLIVGAADLFLVGKCFLLAFVAAVLETMAVESVPILIPTDIGDRKGLSLVRTLVADPPLAYVDWRRLGTIAWVVPIVQRGSHIACFYGHLVVFQVPSLESDAMPVFHRSSLTSCLSTWNGYT